MLDATALEEHLRTYGVDVQSLAIEHGESEGEGERGEGRTLELTYMTAFPGRTVHHAEMGRALNALVDLARNGDGDEDGNGDVDGQWEPYRLEATVERSPGDVLGTWHARREWFEDYLSYRIDDEALSARVLDTLEE
jgi:hypothetical protein